MNPNTEFQLLEMTNRLSVLRCWHCQGVPATTRDEVKKTIARENYDIFWEWYPYIDNEDEMTAALAAAQLAELQ